jgi:hypothetical protein
MLNSIQGKWKGQYTYGQGYPSALVGRTVEFMVDLFIDNNHLSGFCQDAGEVAEAFEKPATIQGTFAEGKIEFIKRYPGRLFIDEKNLYAYEDIPSSDIIYKGVLKKKLLSRKYYFKGTWSIETIVTNDNGKEECKIVRGKWKMYKDN